LRFGGAEVAGEQGEFGVQPGEEGVGEFAIVGFFVDLSYAFQDF